jgi:hypothetical protein
MWNALIEATLFESILINVYIRVFRQAVGNMMNRLLIQEIKGEKII